jgi:calcium/calmodulin-dependent protein kinase I
VHRDIKPENILLANQKDFSSLKLIDFGLSSQYFEIMGDFEFCGTLLYMAPEQLEKRIYTKSIDIWSCGIIMYQLLNNGIHPFYNKGDHSSKFCEKLKLGKWNSICNLSKYVLKFFLFFI